MVRLSPAIRTVPGQPACCSPLAVAPLSAAQANDLAVRLKAIADPARLRLLSLLLASDGHQACTCELTGPLQLAQPTVTHHLRKLLEAGLVTASRRGVWTYYTVELDALAGIAAAIAPPAPPS